MIGLCTGALTFGIGLGLALYSPRFTTGLFLMSGATLLLILSTFLFTSSFRDE